VPELLSKLEHNTEQLWGSMNASKMLNHLWAGTRIMMSKRTIALEVEAEKLPKLKAFLMSDRAFGESLPKPQVYLEYENENPLAFMALKESFLKDLTKFDLLTSTEKDFWSMHPSFGKLNAEETRQLQYKHIRHHFQQFGLM